MIFAFATDHSQLTGAWVAHSTRKAARLTMNSLSMPLQRPLASERLGAKVAHGRLSWEEEKAAAAVAAASEQSRRSDKPLNRRTTPPAGRFSCVSLGGISCKSVGCILDRKNRPIGSERSLGASSDYPG